MRVLFGNLTIGKIPFADPTDIFEDLRKSDPQVFAPGIQNDFHEVYTLLLEKISDGYKNTSIDESRFINKLLFGKMITKIDFQ